MSPRDGILGPIVHVPPEDASKSYSKGGHCLGLAKETGGVCPGSSLHPAWGLMAVNLVNLSVLQ